MPTKNLDELFAGADVDYAQILDAVDQQDLDMLRAIAAHRGVDSEGKGYSGIVDAMVKQLIRPRIIRPTVVTGYLSDQMPLAASSRSDERIADAFQVIAEGAEIVKAYQEEVNPHVLRRKLGRQAIESGDDEIRTDTRLIEACEMGLPPMYGVGIGLDRTTAILTKKPIANVIPIPLTARKSRV